MTTAPRRRDAGPPPDAIGLHDAALAYLARYAATEVGLRRVLERRVERWGRHALIGVDDADDVTRQVGQAKRIVREVVGRLVAAGAVNDAVFAENRTRTLVRAGRSRQAVAAHLAAKGVGADVAHSALVENGTSELAAALVLARKRRIGPFRMDAPPDHTRQGRELAILARAGFPHSVAREALAMATDAAEALVNELRR
jgi:regulatory protein